jgi:hypothetical protein
MKKIIKGIIKGIISGLIIYIILLVITITESIVEGAELTTQLILECNIYVITAVTISSVICLIVYLLFNWVNDDSEKII